MSDAAGHQNRDSALSCVQSTLNGWCVNLAMSCLVDHGMRDAVNILIDENPAIPLKQKQVEDADENLVMQWAGAPHKDMQGVQRRPVFFSTATIRHKSDVFLSVHFL